MSTAVATTNKPKWVEALEEAERVLRLAEEASSENGERDALTRLAGMWRDIAFQYKDMPHG